MRKVIVSAVLVGISVSLCLAAEKVFYSDGPRNSKKIALTFDDGPGFSTNKVLDILNEKEAVATFFLLGAQAVKNPKDAKRIADEGHEIANHTYGHVNFYAYKEDDKEEKIESELLKSERSIEDATGVRPFLVRYPHGYSRPDAREIAKKNGYFVINWTFGCDWELGMTAEEMREKYFSAIKNGAVFLMHDTIKNGRILVFLGDFIDEIRAKGYEIVTVSELLELQDTRQPKEIILEEPQ